jgi:UDP-N-acetylmuramyl tripeptide synthase
LAGLRGGGSSLPGLVVEKIDRDFAVRLLAKLPLGVVVISGTNGKTTTTRIVRDLLTSAGLRVFTNDSGSNFMRGVISSLLRVLSLSGRLEADIAVLELDEAHAVDFARRVRPRQTLLLNVMRDQLDRFGEIDHTAELLAEVARNTTGAVVLNREDRRVAAIAASGLNARVHWYGLAPDLHHHFPEDDELYASDDIAANAVDEPSSCPLSPDVVLAALDGSRATFQIAGVSHSTELALKGVYNAFNAAGALALARVVLAAPATTDIQLVAALARVTSAFGRGEEFLLGATSVELLLVKNPGGFRLALESFSPQGQVTMIAINDDYADGRDMSWLYDVSFASLRTSGVAMVSGTRAYDMALRLHYDEVPFAAVQTDSQRALALFLADRSESPHRIYCTYTAMLALRRRLAAQTDAEKVM